jgi:hypothetical protein
MNGRETVNASEARGRTIDFLGYRFTVHRIRLRKSIKQTFARKSKRLTDKDRRREVLASYWGWCKWGDCKHLWNKLTDNDMSFASLGFKKRDLVKDGQKFFDVPERKLMDILNMPFTVLDFQPNITTRQGPGRYCVLCEQDGQRFKFITNCFNIKDVLDQASEAEKRGSKVFPVDDVRVKRRSLGDGKSAYYFEE